MEDMLRMISLAWWPISVAIVIVLSDPGRADDNRYTAVFGDGSRIAGVHLTDWGTNNQPKLNGRPLFDQSNHIRWLKKETIERPAHPTSFIEFVGGDCLPARVIRSGGPSTLDSGELPAHFVVEPTVMLTWPEGTQTSRMRVLTRWLQRIVWERRSSDQYELGTLYFKDGRQLAFRSIRFNKAGASVLTDSERRTEKGDIQFFCFLWSAARMDSGLQPKPFDGDFDPALRAERRAAGDAASHRFDLGFALRPVHDA
jgi:hypothetical protein